MAYNCFSVLGFSVQNWFENLFGFLTCRSGLRIALYVLRTIKNWLDCRRCAAFAWSLLFYTSVSTDLMMMLEDPASFTGRAEIWSALFRYSADHFFLGSGYGSFWETGSSSPLYAYSSGWIVRGAPHAHNGYIDLLIQTGLTGLVIGIFAVGVLPFRKLLTVKIAARERWLFSAIISFCLLHDLLETTLFDRVNPIWVMLLCILAFLSGRSPGLLDILPNNRITTSLMRPKVSPLRGSRATSLRPRPFPTD